MSSLPASVNSPVPPVPSLNSTPQGSAKVAGHEETPPGSHSASTSLASGKPLPLPNNISGVTRSASTKSSLSDISESMSALDVGTTKSSSLGKRKPVTVSLCSPPASPRSAPPSPDDASPPATSPTITSTIVTSSTPCKKRARLFEDDEEKMKVAKMLFDMGLTASKCIMDTSSPAVAAFRRGGANADAEKSEFCVTSTAPVYSLVLDNVGEATEDQFLTYFKLNDGKVPATSSISVHSGTAILKYDSREDWDAAVKHNWSIGKIWKPKDFDPTHDYDVYYRVCFSGSNFDIDNLHQRVKAYFTAYDIDITNAKVTNNPNIVMAYLRTAADLRKYDILRLKKRIFSLPPFGRVAHHTLFNPLPALTATNDPNVPCIFVGRVPPGAEEELVKERFRLAAREGNFDPDDVIAFGAYRYPGTTKTSRYGYLHVFGKSLADHLIASKIATKEGVFELAYAEERPKSKKQRKN